MFRRNDFLSHDGTGRRPLDARDAAALQDAGGDGLEIGSFAEADDVVRPGDDVHRTALASTGPSATNLLGYFLYLGWLDLHQDIRFHRDSTKSSSDLSIVAGRARCDIPITWALAEATSPSASL